MIRTNSKTNIDSSQIPERFQFLEYVYQAIDFVKNDMHQQDRYRICKLSVEIEKGGY